MPLLLPQPGASSTKRRLWETLGPGGSVMEGAGNAAAAFARSQVQGMDPRSWNDPVTPQVDEQGRPVNAGVVMPLGPGNQMVRQLQDLLKMGQTSARRNPFENKPLTQRMRQSIEPYGTDEYPLPMPNPREQVANERMHDLEDYTEDYVRDTAEKFKVLRQGHDVLGEDAFKRNVSWDQGKGPLPPPSAGKAALDRLLDKMRPTQLKQMKMIDDEADAFDQGDSPFNRFGKGFDQGPLAEHPKLFRPLPASPFEREEWQAWPTRDVGGMRLPGVGPRADANQQLKAQGGFIAKVEKQQLRRHRETMRDPNQAPPPRHPDAYSEHYFPGAELNLVAKRAHPLVQKLNRISKGRRGGV